MWLLLLLVGWWLGCGSAAGVVFLWLARWDRWQELLPVFLTIVAYGPLSWRDALAALRENHGRW